MDIRIWAFDCESYASPGVKTTNLSDNSPEIVDTQSRTSDAPARAFVIQAWVMANSLSRRGEWIKGSANAAKVFDKLWLFPFQLLYDPLIRFWDWKPAVVERAGKSGVKPWWSLRRVRFGPWYVGSEISTLVSTTRDLVRPARPCRAFRFTGLAPFLFLSP